MADPFEQSFDAFLQSGALSTKTEPKDEGFAASFGSFLSDMEDIGRRNAKLNIFGARDAKPDQAARAIELAPEAGLPAETVERNLPDVEAQIKAARQDKLLRDNPGLVRWLQDATNARIAHDDFEKLGFFEKTWQTMQRSWGDARLSNERNRLGYEDLMGAGTPEGRARIGEIDKQLRKPQGGNDDVFQRVVRATSGLVGGFADQFTSDPVLASTALGAGIGAVAGPLDVVTVPGGAAVGFLGGLVADGFRTGAGQIWLSLKDMRDSEGHAIEEPIAIGASVLGGLVLGALNAVGFRGAGQPVAEGAQALVRMAVQDAVKTPTASAALGQFGLGLAKSAGTGAMFGALNEGTIILAEQLAREISDGSFPTLLDSEQERRAAQERIAHSIVDMAMGFGALGVMGHGTGLVANMARARQAAGDSAFLERLNTAAADSATRKRAPDAFARFVEQQANGSPIETLFIPAARVRELYQRFGLDPFEIGDHEDPLLGFVPDRRRQLEQGLATNGDVAVPLAQYIAKLSGTEVHNALKDDIRVRPDGLTMREAREFQEHYAEALAERGEQVKASAAEMARQGGPGMEVMDHALKLLRGAGYTLDTARQYAALLTARYVTRADRLGTDALTEYRRQGLEIHQVMPERLRQYTPDEIDVMLGELKANMKGAAHRPLLGPTLLEHLAAKGGLKDVGGDLAAMDADKWHRDKPFRPRLVRESGRGLDDAALTAFESGYFPELVGRVDRPSADHLLAAIRDELAGKERRPDPGDGTQAVALERRAAMADLDRVLNEAGIDLRQSSVKEAKAALERYQRDALPGYQQARVFHQGPIEDSVIAAQVAKLSAADWYPILDWRRPGEVKFESSVHGAVTLQQLIDRKAPAAVVKAAHDVVDHVRAASQKVEPTQAGHATYQAGETRFIERHPEGAEVERRAEFHAEAGDVQFTADVSYVASGNRVVPHVSDVRVLREIEGGNEVEWARLSDLAPAEQAAARQAVAGELRRNAESIAEDHAAEAEWNAMSPAEQRLAEERQAREALERDRAHTDHIEDAVKRALARGWKPEFDGQGRLRAGMPSELREFASPLSQRKIYKTLRGEGFDEATYWQPDGRAGARGSIRFEDGRTIVSLFQERNLSTFLHETGHLFLEELIADARMSHAPAQLKNDLATVLKWFGVNDASEIATAHHEQWARAFEAWTMEGKAPSVELGSVFQRFKAWLMSIYKTVSALHTPINDDIRGVMDRLVATDDQIAVARERIGEKQLFASPEQAGMTDAEFGAYNRAVERSRSRAETDLLKKVMNDVRRRRQAAWQAEADTMREEVRQEIDRRADIATLQYLRSGRLPDQVEGVDLPALKLSRDALVEMYGGPGVLDLLPRGVPPIVIARGGVHPDVVAETVGGFRSGRDMVDALLSLEDQQRQLRERGEKKSIRSWLIDQETDRRMTERHGDMLKDGSIQEEALGVLHNEDALAVHAVELRSLGRRAGLSRETTPLDVARRWAADAIGDKSVKDATVLGNYQRTEAVAARAVEAALLKGDYAEAFRQKQAQMLAAALYSEARKAAAEVESGQRLLARYADAATLKAMDQAYLEQIHGLLERFDFRQAKAKEVARRRSFAEWATEQEANGVDVVAPTALWSDAFRTHYSEMTVAEFRGLVDSVKQIAHLGRLKKELTVNAEKREFDAVVQETVERLAKLPQREVGDDINPARVRGLPGVAARIGTYARKFNGALLKMETIIEWLDGKDVDGPFNRVVWEPIARAQHERNDLLKDYTGKLVELRNGLDKATQRRLLDKVDTPELLNPETLRPYTMRLEEVAALALNWGNAGNREKMLKGYKWSEEAVNAVLGRHMTPDLWRFVQGTWDLIETLWPRIEALERKVNGVAPEKVERVEVETPHGKFAGGYYPVVYDPLKSFDAAERAARNNDSLFENIYTRATTPKGFTKERSEGYARPIYLSLDVIPRHVAEVIHDVTHREAVMQADKFLGNREVMKAVEGTLGREYVDQFRPWLQSIANEYAQDRRELSAWNELAKSTRMRATMVGLGFRLTTILQQPFGLFDAAEAIGSRWVAAGLAEAYGNPMKWKAARDFVFERSGEVRNRMNQTERDVRDAMRGLLGQTGWVADARRFAYYGIAMMDIAVVLPTWLGAYKKALHDGAAETDAVSLADRAVRDSQGSSSAKDLAAIQRGEEWQKLTTMFYSYFSHFYQRQADIVHSARQASGVGDVAHLLARTFFLMVVPALGSALFTGHGPKEDEDWGPWAARKVGFGLFTGIPLARDVANMADNELGGEYARGYQFTPAARLVDTVWKAAKDVGKAVTGDDPSERWVQHSLDTAGYVFGLPLGQAGQTAQFLYNVREGTEAPDNIAEWLKGLTFGKTKEK